MMIPLNQIQVPKPCGEDWDAMDGDARRRFCADCGCHVHDLSAMTERAAQDLLDRAEGRLCVRFQTHSDGTILTQDAPLPTERRVFWPRRLAAAASWALALMLGSLGLTARAETASHPGAHATPRTHAKAPVNKRVTLGKIAMPRPPLLHTLGIIAVPPPTPPSTTMGAPLAPSKMGDVAPLPPKKK